MRKHQLIDTFDFALEFRKKYIGVRIETEGKEEPEYIIHPCNGVATKMACYMGEYNEDMVLKSNEGIRMTRVAAADTEEKVKELLEGAG